MKFYLSLWLCPIATISGIKSTNDTIAFMDAFAFTNAKKMYENENEMK
jgi:hypothetical protein